jgi:hypothetical protein
MIMISEYDILAVSSLQAGLVSLFFNNSLGLNGLTDGRKAARP